MADDATAGNETPTYTLDELLARCEGATSEQAKALVARYDEAELVEEGAAVRTARITKDAVRIYGMSLDFLEKATPEERQALRGISPLMVKVAIRAVAHADQLYQQLEDSKSGKKNAMEALAATAEQQREAVIAGRGVLLSALDALAAGDAGWTTLIGKAQGSIVKPEDLARSVDNLVKLALQMHADTSPDLVALRQMLELGDDWPAELEQLKQDAAEYEEAATKAAAAKSAPPVAQADVDYWDGVNLVLLRKIIRAHEAGHRKLPRVPRLVPIALRRWYSRSAPKPKAEPEAPPA